MPPENTPLFENVTLAVRIILFVICLVENSIAIFILYKNIRNGRKTFAQYILINIACTDILRAFIYYPAEFVKFSHGEFVWVVEGLAGDVLCKVYAFLVQIPGDVLILSLVALACDVTRNLSSKGRKEHTQKFSRSLIGFFWVTAAGLSAFYLVISRVESNECVVDVSKQLAAIMLQLIHAFMFVAPAALILTILNLLAICLVKRRKKEIIGPKRAERINARRQRKIGYVEDLGDVQEMQFSTRLEPGREADFTVRETSLQQPSTSTNAFETLIEISTKDKTLNKGSDSNIGVDVGEPEDAQGSTSVSAQEESFETTRTEAKITSATSVPFAILSIIQLILPYVYPSYNVYLLFAIQIAEEIYAVIKPGIYACTDKEFRKRYKTLSPFACCCIGRIRQAARTHRNN